MKRYYFDLRDGVELVCDEEGLELRSLAAVQDEAAKSLADMTRDEIRKSAVTLVASYAIEVRDDQGPVMEVRFNFQMRQTAMQ